MRCIVTGANAGIGRSAALGLARRGVGVVLVCRNMEKAELTQSEIVRETGNTDVTAMRADLSLLADVRRFIEDYISRFNNLDVLINNAADFDLSRRQPHITSEGLEAQFATNHLAPFLLVKGLMPLLQASADGRIINIASKGLLMYPRLSINFNNLNGEKKYTPTHAYYQYKLAQLIFTLDLNRRLTNSSISAYCLRVPAVKVDMGRYNISPVMKALYRFKSRAALTPEKMAEAYIEIALGEKRNGAYYDENLQEVAPGGTALNEAQMARLWEVSDQLTN
jgi:NAD(P)-dependent dehydrogenase (short-subunit alcohol dehydrogenase family)